MKQVLPKRVREYYDLIEAGRFEEAMIYRGSSAKDMREIEEWENSPEMDRYISENGDKALIHLRFNQSFLDILAQLN